MPTYQYRCTECGEDLEVVQKFSDDPLKVCPACQGSLRKVFSPVGIVFKGSGFYRNDSRNGSGPGSGDGAAKDGAAKKDKEPAGAKSESGDSGKSSANGSSSGSADSSSSSGSSGSGSSGSSGSSGKSGEKSSSAATPAASKAG